MATDSVGGAPEAGGAGATARSGVKHVLTLHDLLVCARNWEADVRILGNVRAEDAGDAIEWAINLASAAAFVSRAASEGAAPDAQPIIAYADRSLLLAELAALRADRDRLREAAQSADALVSKLHDVLYSVDLARSMPLTHEAANALVWQLHDALRAALTAATPTTRKDASDG